MNEELLASWRDGDARQSIIEFVELTCGEHGAPAEERVAVFDNDGTLWCEKPMPIQLDFILRRLGEMAADEPALRERQPWRSAHERDYAWLSSALTDHYHGDDTKARALGGGVLAAFANISVDAFAEQA